MKKDNKQKSKHVSLSAILSLQGLISVAICSFCLCSISLFILSRIINSNVNKEMSLTLDVLNEQLNESFIPYEMHLYDFTAAVQAGISRKKLDVILHKIQESFGDAGDTDTDIYYATTISRYEEGGYFLDGFNWEPDSDWIPSTRDWWKDALAANGKIAYGKPYIDAMTGLICISVSYCAYNSDKELMGVCAIDIYLNQLMKILMDVKMVEGGFLMMIQDDGTIAADTSNPENSSKKIEELNIEDFEDFLYGKEENSVITINGKKYFAHFIFNQRTGYKIVQFIPKEIVYKPFYQTLNVMLIISTGFALLIALGMALTTRKILMPLNEMIKFVTDFISSLEKGSEDYSPRVNVSAKNEIGRLAESINLFISKLELVMIQIHKSQEKEHEISEKEHRISANLFEEAQNLVVSAKETAATSQDSSAAVKEIVATMEDTNDLSENISKKIKDVSGVANITSTDVVEGVAQIELNVKQLHEIFDANQQTLDGIKNLSEKIESIWDIVSLINNVADQAKIIAFNAELEASTAGEAGKSFRIVANEIRRLSDGIIDGTREIKEKITEIQHSSDTLILASESSTAKINEGYENARDLDKKFDSIKKSAEITAKSADDIADIIQQQTSASEQILIAIKEIAAGVENFTVATDNISTAAENVRKISEDLNNASHEE